VHAIWVDIEEASSVVALVGLPYLMLDKRRRLPNLAFEKGGIFRQTFDSDNLTFGRITFSGTVKNKSLESNTIDKVFLVVWRTKRRMGVRRYGYGGVQMLGEDETPIGPPLTLPARSSRTVKIVCEFPLTGSSDAHLFNATKPLPGNSNFLLPRYEYDLAFEDIEGNLFDINGYPLSRKSIDLRWTIDNAWEQLKDGKPLPLVRHLLRIFWEEVRFLWRKLLRFLGL
jgi:hypothetical protein